METSLLIQACVTVAMLAPPPCTLMDAERFPPPQYLWICARQNREYQLWCEAQILWASSGGRERYDLQEALTEARALYSIIDAAGGSVGYDGPSMESDPEGATAYRLRWLGTLRELIGEEAYQSGQLPPPLPLWRFHWAN